MKISELVSPGARSVRHRGWSVRHRGAVAALAAAVLVGGPVATGSLAGATPLSTTTTTCSLGLSAPDAAATIGKNFFVANSTGNSVTEVNGSTGACVNVFSGSTYGFHDPTAEVAVHGTLYVGNSNGASSSLTKFVPTTSTATILSGSAYGFDNPVGMTATSSTVAVLNANSTVTVIRNGTPTIFSGATYHFNVPTSIAISGNDLFVLNEGGGNITEINLAVAPATVTMLTSATYGFNFTVPSGTPVAPQLLVRSGDLWVTNPAASQVNEIKIATLAQIQKVVDSNLAMPGPVLSGGNYVYTTSPPGGSPMVSQVTASTGSVNWMMCNTNDNYYFNNPQAGVVAGGHLWIVNEGGISAAGPSTNTNGPSLTEMATGSGALVGYFT